VGREVPLFLAPSSGPSDRVWKELAAPAAAANFPRSPSMQERPTQGGGNHSLVEEPFAVAFFSPASKASFPSQKVQLLQKVLLVTRHWIMLCSSGIKTPFGVSTSCRCVEFFAFTYHGARKLRICRGQPTTLSTASRPPRLSPVQPTRSMTRM
jgi:hypothetical protein